MALGFLVGFGVPVRDLMAVILVRGVRDLAAVEVKALALAQLAAAALDRWVPMDSGDAQKVRFRDFRLGRSEILAGEYRGLVEWARWARQCRNYLRAGSQ